VAAETDDDTREPSNPLFFKLPADWDDLTEEERKAWARSLLDRFLGSRAEMPRP